MTAYVHIPWDYNNGVSIGDTRPLPRDKNSVWNDPTWFNIKTREELKTKLLKEASEKFPKLPAPVLLDILDAVMFSNNQMTNEGTGLLPVDIVCIPKISIFHENVRYQLHEGEANKALRFFRNEICPIEETRRKEKMAEKRKKEETELFETQIQHLPTFLTAFNKAKAMYPEVYKDAKAYWDVAKDFIIEDVDMVKNIASGKQKLPHCKS